MRRYRLARASLAVRTGMAFSKVKTQRVRENVPHVEAPCKRPRKLLGDGLLTFRGGVKGGVRYGATDEHGIKAEVNKMHIHDLHATVLHLPAPTTPASPTTTAAATSG